MRATISREYLCLTFAVAMATEFGLGAADMARAQSSSPSRPPAIRGQIRGAERSGATATERFPADPALRLAGHGNDYPPALASEQFQPPTAPPKLLLPAAPPAAPPASPPTPTYYATPAYAPVYPSFGYAPQAVPMTTMAATPAFVPQTTSVPNYFLPSAPAAAPAASPMAVPATPFAAMPMASVAAMPMAAVPMAPAAAPAGVAGLASQTTSVATLGSRSRVRVRSRPFSGLATRVGEALQGYGRQRIETSQEVELAASTQPAGGVTNISTTSAIPQAPQQAAFTLPQAPQPPAAPEAPQLPTPSPQGDGSRHHWHGHFHK